MRQISWDEVEYGSIYQMDRQFWWDLTESGDRAIPATPDVIVELKEISASLTVVYLTFIIRNLADNSIEIPIFPSPSIFAIELMESEKVQYTGPIRRPPAPPPPHLLRLPAQCELILQRTFSLQHYRVQPGEDMSISWTFMTWHRQDRQSSSISIQIPPR